MRLKDDIAPLQAIAYGGGEGFFRNEYGNIALNVLADRGIPCGNTYAKFIEVELEELNPSIEKPKSILLRKPSDKAESATWYCFVIALIRYKDYLSILNDAFMLHRLSEDNVIGIRCSYHQFMSRHSVFAQLWYGGKCENVLIEAIKYYEKFCELVSEDTGILPSKVEMIETYESGHLANFRVIISDKFESE